MVIKTLGPDPDPDSLEMLGPDQDSMYPDPQLWKNIGEMQCFFGDFSKLVLVGTCLFAALPRLSENKEGILREPQVLFSFREHFNFMLHCNLAHH